MPWLGIIVATLYALEYESRIPTDRGTITETGNTPVFEPRGHPRVDHQVIRNDSSSSSSSRFFPLSPRNGSSRRAIEREPICIPRKRSVFVILVILVVARFPYLETKRIFVDERIPLKSNPVTTGERDTISWRMAVSTFPRIAVREEELDRRTHRCRSDLRRDFRSGSIPPFPIRANSNVSTR